MSMISIGRKAKCFLGSSPAVHVLRDVITPKEEQAMLEEVAPILRRRRYQRDHWDQVIVGYKEVERAFWQDPKNEDLVQDIRARIETVVKGIPSTPSSLTMEWLPVHVIDLEESGFISPHVDSVKFSGGLVCGLSLMSSSIMTLSPPKHEYSVEGKAPSMRDMAPEEGEKIQTIDFDETVHMYLPPRSLYILEGPARYDLAHSVDIRCSEDIAAAFKHRTNSASSGEGSVRYHDDIEKLDAEFANIIQTETFERSRRISLIFRDARL